MNAVAGLRRYAVLEGVTEGTWMPGGFQYIEVTNNGASPIKIYINDFPEQGHVADGIPVKNGETRSIPITTYKFRASGAVTVVAYGA